MRVWASLRLRRMPLAAYTIKAASRKIATM
jgi:hypothetical protein